MQPQSWKRNIDTQNRDFLTAWLPSLPAEGFRGSAAELWELLCRFTFDERPKWNRFRIPVGAGLTALLRNHDQYIARLGWTLRVGRTGKGRFIEIRKGAK
jgi:hypothetical protein